MPQDFWTRNQTIVAFNLYCKIPFSGVSSNHPDIIRIAKIIGRSPNSVKMKIGNFGSFDPELKKKGVVGLENTSKLDKDVWDEFNNNWEKLAYESELLIAQFQGRNLEEEIRDDEIKELPEGREKESLVKIRINQNFFRQTILSAYNNKCCITGIELQQLLVASHIIPWSKDKKNRLNPHNGLCLNSFHDKAFDKGLITITPDFVIKVSKLIFEHQKNKIINDAFLKFQNSKITIPERFIPKEEFLDYHFHHIFQK